MSFQERLARVTAHIEKSSPDVFLVTSLENIYYLTGFTGSFALLLITPKGSYLFTDGRYIEQAKKEAHHVNHLLLQRFTPMRSIAEFCAQNEFLVLGFERDRLLYHEYAELRTYFGRPNLQGLSCVVESFRAIKDEKEIALLRQAEHIGDAAFQEVLSKIKVGITEKEIALELEVAMRRRGATATSFSTIVASGTRSSLPHGVASDKPIQAGDMVVMDFGCMYEHYCSDMTRTIAVGEPGDEARRMYQYVLEAQLAGLQALKEGVTGEAVHQAANAVFEEYGVEEFFTHGLGHSVGLEIHEQPALNSRNTTPLVAGQIITVEPGLYIPNRFGIRIEDMVVVTKEGIDNLTTTPKSLLVL